MPEDNPADDVQLTKEEWELYERKAAVSRLKSMAADLSGTEDLAWFHQIANRNAATRLGILSDLKVAVAYIESLESAATVEKLRAALLKMMRDAGDLIHALQSNSDRIFDKSFPWSLVNKLGETGRDCRELIGEHELWDLTNDAERALMIRRALGKGDKP